MPRAAGLTHPHESSPPLPFGNCLIKKKGLVKVLVGAGDYCARLYGLASKNCAAPLCAQPKQMQRMPCGSL